MKVHFSLRYNLKVALTLYHSVSSELSHANTLRVVELFHCRSIYSMMLLVQSEQYNQSIRSSFRQINPVPFLCGLETNSLFGVQYIVGYKCGCMAWASKLGTGPGIHRPEWIIIHLLFWIEIITTLSNVWGIHVQMVLILTLRRAMNRLYGVLHV